MSDAKHDILNLLEANPIDEPDRAKITWPKIKKIKLKRKRRVARKHHFHPGTKEARMALQIASADLTTCEECGEKTRTHIHHVDRNPFNNEIQNLRVLCERCHREEHSVESSEVIGEYSIIAFIDEDVVEEEIELEKKNYLSISLCMNENEVRKAPKGAILSNNIYIYTQQRQRDRYNFSKKAYSKHTNMPKPPLKRFQTNTFECIVLGNKTVCNHFGICRDCAKYEQAKREGRQP